MDTGRFFQTPGYYHEEMGPGDPWSYEVVPLAERYVAPWPFLVYLPVYAPPYPYGP